MQSFHGLGALGVGVRLLWAGQGVSRVRLSVSEQCALGQRVAFKQLFGPSPYPIHPRGARRPRLSLTLGEPGANAPLVSSPLCLESDPREPRVQRPGAAVPAPPRGGEAKGVVREPEKPEPQPASPAQGWAARSESS